MTIFKYRTYGVDFSYCSTALQKSHLPRHRNVLEDRARDGIIPLNRNAHFLKCTAVGARMIMVRIHMGQSWIRTVTEGTYLLWITNLKLG